jgi:hypothetical protein
MNDPRIRRVASEGKVKSAATKGPGGSCLGSAPRAGAFSWFQYLTVPLHRSTGKDRAAAEHVAGVLLGGGWTCAGCEAAYIGTEPDNGLCAECTKKRL